MKLSVCCTLYLPFYTVLTETIATAIGEDICIPVPHSTANVIIGVWPKSPTIMDMNNNCECPLCDHPECNLDTCHCVYDTTYNLTLNSSGSTKYHLCLHKIRKEMNGMYIHFFHDLLSYLSTAPVKVYRIYRLYVASFRINIGNGTHE